MSDYDVGVGLSVEGGNTYQTNMSQAIALTEQYTKVADGMAGSMADLSAGMVGLTSEMTGFTKTQSVALDTAAGYQKMMEKIEATTKITGGNFTNLQKVTKGFARDFPVGMGKAVQVMQDMQAVGIKNEKQLEKLGKSFIKFEGVTGGSAKEFMQLNKTMGNGVDQFEKLSDSLVNVTSKMGGSAPAVVAFSKALAPVAQTVGLSQTQVMGLSTAMSTLGEDGYRAANTFNKVLLDMNRSVRDGGPGLKAYADLMGTTSNNLKGLLKSNPSEFLSKFTEAVGKGGVNTSRMMETLGFDSVRDTRSIQALANSGGPRKAIEEAVKGYGDGSTSKSAEVMFDGLTDSVIELKETMSQTVVNISQPMLGVAKGQVDLMKSVAGVAENITGSELGQGVAKGAGIGGMVGNFAMGGANALAMVAMGKLMKEKFQQSNFWKETKTGWTTGASGGTLPPGAPWQQRFAAGAGGAMYDPSRPPISPWQSFKQAAGQTFNIGRDLAGRALLGGLGNPYLQAAGKDAVHSPGGDAYRARVSELRQQEVDRKAALRGLPTSAGYVPGTGPQSYGQYLGARAGAFGQLVRGVGGPDGQSFRGALWNTVKGADALMDRGVARGGQMIRGGLGALGMNPGMVGLLATAGAAYSSFQQQKASSEASAAGFGSKNDIYGTFNGFMESVGMAGRGLRDFSVESGTYTQALVEQNGTLQQAAELTREELNAAHSTGYKPGLVLQGDDRSVEGIASQVMNMMGTSTDPKALARALSDVANITGSDTTARQVAGKVGSQFAESTTGRAKPDYAGTLANIIENANADHIFNPTGSKGQNMAQSDLAAGLGRSVMQGIMADSAAFTGTKQVGDVTLGAQDVLSMKALDEMWAQTRAGMNGNANENLTAAKAMAPQLGAVAGLSEEEARSVGLVSEKTGSDVMEYSSASDWVKAVAGTEEAQKIPFFKAYQAAQGAGYLGPQESLRDFSGGTPDREREAQTTEGVFQTFFKGAGLLNDGAQSLISVINKANVAAREQGKTPTDTTLDKRGWSAAELNYDAYANESDDQTKLSKAAESLIEMAGKGTNGNGAQQMRNLQRSQAQFTEGSTEWNAFSSAIEKLAPALQVSQSGRVPGSILAEQIRAGRAAAEIPKDPTNTALNSVNTSTVNIGMSAQEGVIGQMQQRFAAMGALQQQTGAIQRQSGIQAGSIARDSALKEKWATEDYETNRGYQKEDFQVSRQRARRDYGRSVGRATRDFGRSQQYAEDDWKLGKARATEDFQKQFGRGAANSEDPASADYVGRAEEDHRRQKKQATEDFNTSQLRATRDYNKQVERANRDFQLQESRAQEDFNKGQTRAGEDYNKNRTRMMQDYAKSMKRLTEDQAKQMYDPFKRMQVEMVMDAGQLVANLDEQAAAVEKQKKTLDKLRELGMTDDTIKALSLADASKAQQASRLLGDAEGNGALVGKMNDSVSRKNTAAGALVQDSGNTQTARMAEDFAQQLARGEEDYNTSTARAQEDFATSSARSKEDFKTAMADSKLDFQTTMADSLTDFNLQMARSDAEYAMSRARGYEDFTTSMNRVDEDYFTNRGRSIEAFNTQLHDMEVDHNTAMRDMYKDFHKSLDRQEAAFEKSIERMRISAANAISDVGANAAASIQSMNEQMVGLFQDIPDMSTTEGQIAAAETLFGKMLGLGIDPADWGTEVTTFFSNIEALTGVKIAGLHAAITPVAETVFDGMESGVPLPTGIASKVDKALGINGEPGAVADIFGLADPNTRSKSSIAGAAKAMWDNLPGQVPVPSAVANKVNKAMGINGENGAVKDLVGLSGSSTGGIGTMAGISKTIWDNLPNQVPVSSTIVTKVNAAMGMDDQGSTTTPLGVLRKLGAMSIDDGGTVAGMATNIYKPLLSQIPKSADMVTKILAMFGVTTDDTTFLGILHKLGLDSNKDGVPYMSKVVYGPLLSEIPKKSDTNTAFDGFLSATNFAINEWLDDWKAKQIKISVDNINGGKTDLLAETHVSSGLGPYVPINERRALGGIDFKPTLAWIAEAGYPEATIPLNQRGADVLAATMSRYLDNTEVRGSQAQQYSSPVINNNDVTYDYRTQFTGAVTVQAQDPDQMAQKLAAKRRRQRLAQPIGGKR